MDCARGIVQSGITEVIVDKVWDADNSDKWRDHGKRTIEMFKEVGVKLRYWEGNFVEIKKLEHGHVLHLNEKLKNSSLLSSSMGEDVQTGGLHKFRYGKEGVSKINADLKKDIQEGYADYYERKAREARNKKILLISIGFVLLVLLGFAFWKLF